MLYYTLWLPILLAVLFTAHKLKFERRTLLLIVSGLVLYYFNFYQSSWLNFATDVGHHAEYIQFIAASGGLPDIYNLTTGAGYHPPTYYLFGAGLYKAAQAVDPGDPLLTVRHLSMALYMVFIVFSTLLLRRVLPQRGVPYYAALALVVFWPVGVVIGARINGDLLLYAGQAGVMYFLLVWMLDKTPAALANAFLCAGIALLGKNSGALFLGASLAFLLVGALQHWRAIITPRMVGSVAFALGCYYLTRLRYDPRSLMVSQGTPINFDQFVHIFLMFDPYLFLDETIINQHQGESQIRFWHWFLRSMVLGDFIDWRPLAVVFAIGTVWLAMLAYLLVGVREWFRALPREKITYAFLMGFAALMVGAMIAMRFIRPDYPNVSDARYVYPLVVLVAACFGLTMRWHEQRKHEILFRAGNGLALGFALLTFALYFAHHLLLTKPQ